MRLCSAREMISLQSNELRLESRVLVVAMVGLQWLLVVDIVYHGWHTVTPLERIPSGACPMCPVPIGVDIIIIPHWEHGCTIEGYF